MSSTLSLTSALAQAITHTGTNSGSKDLTVLSTNGKVLIEAVTFNAGAISTVTTLNMDGTLTLEKSGAQIINHNHDSLLTIQSTGNTKIEAVTFDAGAISTVTTLAMGGALSGVTTLNMDSTLTLEKSGAQIINHNHASLLTIQSTGNTKIEAVEFNAGAVASMTTLNMDGTLTLETSGAQIINHNHASLLTIQSTGNTKIEAVEFNAGAVTSMTTLNMDSTLTLEKSGAQIINHNHDSLLTIQSTGDTKIEAVTFDAGAISTVTTLSMSGTLSLSSRRGQAITHTGRSGSDHLTVSSGGDVLIEEVTFAGAAISTVTTLDMSGALTGLTTLTASGEIKTTGGFLVTNTRGIKGGTGTNVDITGTACAGDGGTGITLTSWHGTIRNSDACTLAAHSVSNSAQVTMQTNHRVGSGSYSGGTVVASMCTGSNEADTGSTLNVAQASLRVTIFQRDFTTSNARFRFSIFNSGSVQATGVRIKICYIVIFSAT